MPKISESSVNTVLASLDIIDVVSDYLTLKKSGSNYKACCPFHEEKPLIYGLTQQGDLQMFWLW